jgi:hypothetical protein
LTTRDTVAIDTPAFAAISERTVFLFRLLSHSLSGLPAHVSGAA